MEKIIISDSFNNKSIEIKKYNFNISKDIKNLKFTLESNKFEHFFCIIKDSNKKIRAQLTFKTRIKEYYLSKNFSSSSVFTKFGKIPKGEWELWIIKPYLIQGEFSITIEETSTPEIQKLKLLDFNPKNIINSASKWYKGDLHVHSNYTDGRQTLNDITNIANDKNFDFLALTDHSTVPTHHIDLKGLFIPGTEITFDDDGHFNIFGVSDFIDYTKFFKINEIKEKDCILNNIIDYYKQLGCFISINHPFHKEIPFTHNINFKNVDFIEVINSPYDDDEHNVTTISFFDFLWKNNYLVFGIGGSDSHKTLANNFITLGNPLNFIYSKNLSYIEIMKALKKGNSYITQDKELKLDITCNNQKILPGDKVLGDVSFSIKYDKSLKWQLIKNGVIIEIQENNQVSFSFTIEKNDYYRVQGYNNLTNKMEIFINPIHFKEKNNNLINWKELVNNFLI